MTLTPKHHTWTEADFELLRNGYDGTRQSIDRLEPLIGASHQAIKQKAIALNLTKRQKYPEWSDEDKAKLAKLTPLYSPKKIGKMIGRTENAVKMEQRRIKCSPSNREWFNAHEVQVLFNMHERTVNGWLTSGKLKAERYQSDKDRWRIVTKDLRDFVIHYPSELQGRKVDIVFLVDLLANNKANGK